MNGSSTSTAVMVGIYTTVQYKFVSPQTWRNSMYDCLSFRFRQEYIVPYIFGSHQSFSLFNAANNGRASWEEKQQSTTATYKNTLSYTSLDVNITL